MAGSHSGYSEGTRLNGVPTLNVIILKFTGEVVVIFSPLKIIHIFYQLFFFQRKILDVILTVINLRIFWSLEVLVV